MTTAICLTSSKHAVLPQNCVSTSTDMHGLPEKLCACLSSVSRLLLVPRSLMAHQEYILPASLTRCAPGHIPTHAVLLVQVKSGRLPLAVVMVESFICTSLPAGFGM